jgi:hypothetical protein
MRYREPVVTVTVTVTYRQMATDNDGQERQQTATTIERYSFPCFFTLLIFLYSTTNHHFQPQRRHVDHKEGRPGKG